VLSLPGASSRFKGFHCASVLNRHRPRVLGNDLLRSSNRLLLLALRQMRGSFFHALHLSFLSVRAFAFVQNSPGTLLCFPRVPLLDVFRLSWPLFKSCGVASSSTARIGLYASVAKGCNNAELMTCDRNNFQFQPNVSAVSRKDVGLRLPLLACIIRFIPKFFAGATDCLPPRLGLVNEIHA